MSSAAAKRFWTTTGIEMVSQDGNTGFSITLDGRQVKTPQGQLFTVASQPLVDVICGEWDAQVETINPDTMPIYKFAVTAIDRVTPQRDAVVDELASYGGSDLLCYREDRDHRLADHQHTIWQPYLDWAEHTYGTKLDVFGGIMPGAQSQQTQTALRGIVDGFSDFHLSGLHSLVTVSGSLILGLAAASNQSSLDQIMDAAFLDDLWQEDKWGYDEDAAKRMKNHRQHMCDAHRYLGLL